MILKRFFDGIARKNFFLGKVHLVQELHLAQYFFRQSFIALTAVPMYHKKIFRLKFVHHDHLSCVFLEII